MSNSVAIFTPKALHSKAQGRAAAQPPSAPWVTNHTNRYTPKGFYKGPRSIPNIAFVNFEPIFATETAEFILECLGLVMLRLVCDVPFEIVHVRRADRESTIAALPLKHGESRTQRGYRVERGIAASVVLTLCNAFGVRDGVWGVTQGAPRRTTAPSHAATLGFGI